MSEYDFVFEDEPSLEPFLSGSHVYGEVNETSDIDIVIRGKKEIAKQLLDLPGAQGFVAGVSDAGVSSTSVKLGPVNLIICHSDRAMEAWREATKKCVLAVAKKRRALTRDEAITIHRIERHNRGIK